MSDKLSQNLQESLVSLLCTNNEEGKIAAGIIDTSLLEPPFDDIAERAIAYQRQYGQAPGAAHVDDIFDHILSDPKHKKHRLYQQVLGGILEQAKGLNGPYILSRLNDFMRAQNTKAAIIQAGQRIQQGGTDVQTDVETILHQALKFRPETLDAGTFLSDKKRILAMLNNQSQATYALGIPELDRRQIGPTAGEALGFMAAKGRGKTWFCVNTGINCLMQGARVVHITLEMKEERIMPRYLQRMFAIAKRDEMMEVPAFELDELDRIKGFTKKRQKPALAFTDPKIEAKIARRMGDQGTRLSRLVCKSFPTGALTVPALEAYLDALELTEKFVPTVLILDYPDLMHIPGGIENVRLGLGELYKQLRGMLEIRNLAGVFPIQSNRAGESAKLITAENTGEDYSKTQTLDMLLTYSQTKREKALGLARIHVDKARNDEDKFTLLITQNYQTGQFVTQSAFMPDNFWHMIEPKEVV